MFTQCSTMERDAWSSVDNSSRFFFSVYGRSIGEYNWALINTDSCVIEFDDPDDEIASVQDIRECLNSNSSLGAVFEQNGIKTVLVFFSNIGLVEFSPLVIKRIITSDYIGNGIPKKFKKMTVISFGNSITVGDLTEIFGEGYKLNISEFYSNLDDVKDMEVEDEREKDAEDDPETGLRGKTRKSKFKV